MQNCLNFDACGLEFFCYSLRPVITSNFVEVTSVVLTGIYRDASLSDITDSVAWISQNNRVSFVSPGRLLSGVEFGNNIVTTEKDNISELATWAPQATSSAIVSSLGLLTGVNEDSANLTATKVVLTIR